jgi:exosome complex exonuclease DIS3/RRP44
VTYFVHPDSAIDKEAAHRSTSTYLVERRLDMLPGLLTTQLCSLRSKEDHLAFSVIWEMDDDANIYDVRFCKSAIHSVASLTYDEAQVMLDSPAPADKVNHSVNLLNKLARILRQRRIDMGALTLASPEVRFKLDSETQNPTDVAMYSLKESNALVEEWMLLANITVSKQILKFYPTLGILRRHQPPSREQFAPLVSSALAVGVNLDISSSKTLADSLDRAVRPDDPYFNKLLRILSTRCMMPAQYFCSGEIPKDQWHHYGLAAPVYTHFTSPIRRYADVLVHRLLAATIGVIALPAANADRSRQQELCTHMNRRHRAAQYAQRGSVNLHTINYFRQRPAAQEAAYVLTVKEDSFTVLVPRFGIEGTLRWEDIMSALDCDASEFDAAAHTMALSSRRAAAPVQSASKKQKKQASAAETPTVVLKLRVFDRVSISIKVDEGSGNGGDRKLVIGLVHEDKDLAEVLKSKPRKTGLAQESPDGSTMQI